MSEQLHISSHEHGIVRLFAIDLPDHAVAGFAEPDEVTGAWSLLKALGAEKVDSEYLEIFPVSNLTGLGLSSYMTEGLGIAEAEIAPDKPQLDALKGHVLIVRSRAFSGHEQTVSPQEPLRWIGTWAEEAAPVEFEQLPSGDAEGTVNTQTRRRPSDAAMSGRVATITLLVLFALVGVMVWVA